MSSKNSNFINTNNQQAGFSLIELLVAMVISLTLIFACTALYSSLKSSTTTAQKLATAQESLRGSFYLLSRSVRQAGSVTVNGAELTTTYGETPTGSIIYSCLGNPRVLDDEDVFFKKEDGLHCYDDGDVDKAQLIALGVETLTFTKISHVNSASATIYDGVKVTMEIDGMPESMKTADGLTFTLALRQKILLDLTE